LGTVIIIFALKILFEKQKFRKIRKMWGAVAGFVLGMIAKILTATP